jgi:hypothetical protein
VRNGWKGLRWTVLATFGTVISLPTAAAQGAQTAQSAQQFLATMAGKVATQVNFVDAAGRTNYVIGKYTGDVKTIKGGLRKTKETVEALPERVVEKQVADIRASVLEAIDAHGRPNPCATRITEVVAPNYDEYKSDAGSDNRSFSFTLTYTNEQWKYEPLSKFMSPAQVIDWSDAKVNRSPQGAITVTSKGQTFPTIHVTYVPGDPDLADRIEYAMKFLVMSCDESTGTGF